MALTADMTLRELIAEVVREELARQRPADEYMSPARAAQLADVTAGTIRRWIRDGKIDAHHAGRAVRVKRADVEKFLRSERRRDDQLTPEQRADRDFG